MFYSSVKGISAWDSGKERMAMKFDGILDSDFWAIANPIMDNLMEGSTNVDHAQNCRDFTQWMKDIVTSEYLENVCHQIYAMIEYNKTMKRYENRK